jgi:hypothetical protein
VQWGRRAKPLPAKPLPAQPLPVQPLPSLPTHGGKSRPSLGMQAVTDPRPCCVSACRRARTAPQRPLGSGLLCGIPPARADPRLGICGLFGEAVAPQGSAEAAARSWRDHSGLRPAAAREAAAHPCRGGACMAVGARMASGPRVVAWARVRRRVGVLCCVRCGEVRSRLILIAALGTPSSHTRPAQQSSHKSSASCQTQCRPRSQCISIAVPYSTSGVESHHTVASHIDPHPGWTGPLGLERVIVYRQGYGMVTIDARIKAIHIQI